MIFALSLLVVTFLAMMAMIYFKRRVLATGREYLFFNEKSDEWLRRNYLNSKKFFAHFNWRTISLFYDYLLGRLENFFLNLYRYLRRKVDKPVNLVKGQGEVEVEEPKESFFLKNIEESQENDKKPG